MLSFICGILTIVLCHAYPAYAAFKAIRRGERKAELRVLRHLAGLSLYMTVETAADWVLGWLPMYALVKLLLLLWLSLPQTNGAAVVYRRLLHPRFVRHEAEIDRFLDSVDDRIRLMLIAAHREAIRVGRNLLTSAASQARASPLEGGRSSLAHAMCMLIQAQRYAAEYISQAALADVAIRVMQAADATKSAASASPSTSTAAIIEEYEDIDDVDDAPADNVEIVHIDLPSPASSPSHSSASPKSKRTLSVATTQAKLHMRSNSLRSSQRALLHRRAAAAAAAAAATTQTTLQSGVESPVEKENRRASFSFAALFSTPTKVAAASPPMRGASPSSPTQSPLPAKREKSASPHVPPSVTVRSPRRVLGEVRAAQSLS